MTTAPETALQQHPLSAWHGVHREPIVLGSIKPSLEHIGFSHYSVTSLAAQQTIESKRPARLDFIPEFLDHTLREFGLRFSDLEWRIETDQERHWRLNPRAPRAARAVVYFIAAGEYIKIGTAAGDAAGRMRELQTGCPYAMEILATVPGGRGVEHELHERFKHLRVRDNGEWFRHEGALADYIAGLK